MDTIISNVAILAAFVLIGWFFGTRNIVNRQHAKILSALTVWIFLPSKTFKGFASSFTLEYLSDKYQIILSSIGVLLALVTITWLLVPRVVKDSYQQRIIRYSLTLSNYGHFGYAFIESVWGPQMLLNALMFGLPFSCYAYTEGYRLLTNQDKISLKRIFNPVLVAMFAGCLVGLSGIKLPVVLTSVVEKSSSCVAPISMLLTGIMVSDFSLKDIFRSKSAYIVCVFRLLLVPAALCFLLRYIFPTEIVMITVLMQAMPCGLGPIIFPNLVGEDCHTGAALAMLSTLASLATIPICVQIIEWLY